MGIAIFTVVALAMIIFIIFKTKKQLAVKDEVIKDLQARISQLEPVKDPTPGAPNTPPPPGKEEFPMD